MKEIYFDNSATTAVCDAAINKICEMLKHKYGNPSSLHVKGLEAENELKSASKIIAESLGVSHEEIYFCSGGTEANNLAVFGVAGARKRAGNKIVTTSVEHSSVLEPMHELEKQGFEVVYLKPNEKGNISAEQLTNAIDDKTILVSIMLVNNEVGALMPIEQAAKAIKRSGGKALLHCDAVQAYGKIPVRANKLGANLITVSSHKINGPKGIGALYVKKGVRLIPMLYGGEQQKKLRPGTENVPMIAGFAAAVSEHMQNNEFDYVKTLHNECISKLKSVSGVIINSDENGFPYIINFSVPGIRSEIMLHYLESQNIYVSSGSACAKGKPSHVLSAMGLDKKIADSAIRISFSKANTPQETELFIQVLKNGINSLAKTK